MSIIDDLDEIDRIIAEAKLDDEEDEPVVTDDGVNADRGEDFVSL